MKLFCYYAFHSVKNQIKKLCRSWVIIFILSCFLIGALIGFGAALLAEHFESGENTDITVPDEPYEDENIEIDKAKIKNVTELVFCAITLSLFFFCFITADKSGSAVFTMPDVNLLFSAPMKPQSVLLFKVMNQILLTLAMSLYIIFQIPNFAINLGFDAITIVSILIAWSVILVYSKLINIFVFTVSSTNTRLKKFIRPAAYAFLILLAGSFLIYYKSAGVEITDAAVNFFNGVWTRYIPVYGWIKGLFVWCIEGNILMAAVSLVLLIAGIVVLTFATWNVKADFYEDAMAKSQETAELLQASGNNTSVKRKKDRSEKIGRDIINCGRGANMFFFKSICNRFRFSHFRFMTKTSETYLVISAGAAIIMKFSAKYENFLLIGIGICVLVFFRSFGNPMANDMAKNYLITVPASAHSKVFWSLAGGTADCILDILPSFLISAIILRANFAEVIMLFLLAVGMDFYASNVMLFIELSLPTSLALQVKQAISIMFIYFGLIPIAAIVIMGFIFNLLSLFIFISAIAAFAIGGIFFAISPLFLIKGRK